MFKSIFSTLLLLSWVQSLIGYVDPDPGCFALQGEFLYFKPTIDQSYYAISSSNNFFGENIFPDGDRFNNNSFFRPAFRIEGAYALCNGCNNLDFRFTYLNADNSDSVSGSFLFDTIGYPGNGAQDPEDTFYSGSADFEEQFRYYAGDATFSRIIFDCCPEYLSILFGLHYVYFKLDEDFDSSGTRVENEVVIAISNRLNRTCRFWGIGPELGLEYRYLLPNCLCWRTGVLSLIGNTRGSLLCSHTKAHFQYNTVRTGPIGVNLNNDPLWRVIPTIDARVGLNYECAFHCLRTNIEIGYELIWYSDCVDTIVGYDVAFAGDSIDVFSNLNMQGPYLAISVSF